MNTKLKHLQIGDLTARLPIIQGGMGVGVSLSKLAGAVAKEGGVGIISTAQIGYDEKGFEKDQAGCNRLAIRKHIQKAKEIACGNGLIGVNIMVALKHYEEHVKEAVAAGADVIISGAGLPMKLPALVSETCRTKIAPIVSSKRALQIILKRWAHRYDRTADFIVIEGPKAGGHLGFSTEELVDINSLNYDEEIKNIIECKKEYEKQYNKKIPVIVAGGIFDSADIAHALGLAQMVFKLQAVLLQQKNVTHQMHISKLYIHAREEDIQIIQSPVGMLGRVPRNEFIKNTEREHQPIKKCYNCLAQCNPRTVHCITQALINAVKGDIENGLIFCGSNVGRIHQMTTVHNLMEELTDFSSLNEI